MAAIGPATAALADRDPAPAVDVLAAHDDDPASEADSPDHHGVPSDDDAGGPAALDPSSRATRHPRRLVLLGLVLVVQVYASIQRRWVQEDGFINIRIAQQVAAGHGPVFNVGERVEAFTSPLWLGLLVALRFVTGGLVPYEWLAVGAGVVLSLLGTACLLRGAMALWTPARARYDDVWWVPLGILVPLALPPFWDFATSGLETALAWAWIGASFAALTTAIRGEQRAELDLQAPPGLIGRYALIGLGPLVRPEMALYAVALGLGLLLLVDRPTSRDEGRWWWGPGVVSWAAIPLAYQIFRMGYFGSLVPNTALAKNASSAVWSRGVDYLANFAGTYWLVIPLILLVNVVVLLPRVRKVQGWAVLCIVAPALAHALYVVWVGGDYMHGRFWLVPVLALIAPIATVPLLPAHAGVGRRRFTAPVGAALLLIWAVIAASSWRPPLLDPHGAIDDQRGLVVAYLGNEHPVRLDEQPGVLLLAGDQLAARSGQDLYVDIQDPMNPAPITLPRPPGSGTFAQYAAIGVAGVAAGLDVSFVDSFGLADPIAARMPAVSELRAGHTHSLPDPWRKARADVISDDGGVVAAKKAMTCGDLARLLASTQAPMTPGRFLENLIAAPANTTLRVPPDPEEAVRRFCGTT